MKKVIKAGFVSVACLIIGHAFAQSQDAGVYEIQRSSGYLEANDGSNADMRTDDLLAPYPFSRALSNPLWPDERPWSDMLKVAQEEVKLGYGWRNVRVEGALSGNQEQRENWLRLGTNKSFSTSSRRLSFSSHKNWTFQITRGRMTRPDQVDPNEEVKRTTLATVYQYPFDRNNWQTTIAFGRSGKKADGSFGNAYLFESLLQINRVHTVFARAERALADELFRDREALYGQNFNTNRFALGYVYNIVNIGPTKLVVGGLASKRSVPLERVASIGKEPIAYKLFVRLSMPMH